eukprot:TRINITY_DN34635_c0_g1_i2.p1 TRINITY_DN34635_c0_g1~~TRINITY_DN34635_c0_g1_i2.p1  ORF type:complete len:220 (+),score=26.13 TRINITY_DN34635_c0_g1_i2:60-719(+)
MSSKELLFILEKKIQKNVEHRRFQSRPQGAQSPAQLGEHSGKILDKLLPLISYCKDNETKLKDESISGAHPCHKKSQSLASNANSDPLQVQNDFPPKNINKTILHLHQRSLIPNIGEMKLECPTLDGLLHKREELEISNPSQSSAKPGSLRFKDDSPFKLSIAKQGAMISHLRTKSDFPPRSFKEEPLHPPQTKHPSGCLLYTSPSPRDLSTSRMPSSA